jgi:class 3 adenylate cyclase/predicted ATPase
MDFYSLLDDVLELLRRRGRVTYRALKRQFHLDDDVLDDLKEELIKAQRVAVDENGDVLVWVGDVGSTPAPSPPAPQPVQAPAAEVDRAVPIESPAAKTHAPEAERRQLTVLFCDLADSTALARQLDPEDYREVVRAYQATCAAVVQRFDGYMAQYLGDGLLVYFGYPQAHEDDAQRAVRAGLEMLGALAPLQARLVADKGIRLAVRLAIHTGLVVVGAVGAGGRQEQLALGDTPNVTARLQGLAALDTVVMSDATWRLVQGYFACDDLGPQTLKGVETPVRAYRVLGTSGAQSRLDVVSPRGLTPLVGREAEVTLLRERWAQARDGLGQVVWLSGEAGIGKSRLVQVLHEHIAAEPHTRLEWRCSPYAQQSPLHPVIAHLHRLLRWRPDDAPAEKLHTLEDTLAAYGLARPEVVPLFAALLSLPLPERYPPLTFSPQRQKQKTLEALLVWFLAEATRQPVLFIVEDLHWVDPSTLEFLTLLIDQGPTARLLTLLTCRPEFHAPWGFRAHLTPLTLGRLPRPQATQLTVRVTGGKALPSEVVEQIVTKTDGVPLFVEELTKMVLESGLLREGEDHYELTGPLPPLAIPATLHDSLMARLDRLATVKDVAQLGATIGRTFAYELLQAASPLDEATLQHGLRQLVEAELVYQRGVPPQATYMFKHALIQDAAYQSLLRSTRQQYHQRLAQVLAEQFPETAETQPELLAHHYTEAGLSVQAIPYWQQAGQKAVERSANVEAISHLTKGLELLTTLPDTPERAQHELTLQIALGVPLRATEGWSAPRMGDAYARARELCQHVGDTPQLCSALIGLWAFYLARSEPRTAQELGEQLLRLAHSVQDPALLLEAHVALANTLVWLGEFAPAHAHLEQGIALYNPQHHRSHILLYGHDPGAWCLGFAAWALWHLGYPDQALQRSHEALTLAQGSSHPRILANALGYAAELHQLRREVQATQELAEAEIVLAREHGFMFFLAEATCFRGWALAEQGQGQEGIAEIRQGLASWRATGAEIKWTYYLTLLAEAYGKAGHVDQGLTVLTEALPILDQSGERRWEAELYRLKGTLTLQKFQVSSATCQVPQSVQSEARGLEAEAEAYFVKAIEIARKQQAKSLELRAVMGLARLWQRQGKHGEARQLLAEIYGWFTEGFDTADLQEAKALLEALA